MAKKVTKNRPKKNEQNRQIDLQLHGNLHPGATEREKSTASFSCTLCQGSLSHNPADICAKCSFFLFFCFVLLHVSFLSSVFHKVASSTNILRSFFCCCCSGCLQTTERFHRVIVLDVLETLLIERNVILHNVMENIFKLFIDIMWKKNRKLFCHWQRHLQITWIDIDQN